ncbi:transposase [Nonomuraea sp. NPDC050404]|uniref:transposase n=1 Tax=Nonomuraea sp. NPDC050404 TaxID=3155783 RepID=UPI0033CA9B82
MAAAALSVLASDIFGVSGRAMMAALVAGERSPRILAQMKIGELLAPFEQAMERLNEISGIGRTAAALILAEIGLDMSRFPTAGHLASWARFAPGMGLSSERLWPVIGGGAECSPITGACTRRSATGRPWRYSTSPSQPKQPRKLRP